MFLNPGFGNIFKEGLFNPLLDPMPSIPMLHYKKCVKHLIYTSY